LFSRRCANEVLETSEIEHKRDGLTRRVIVEASKKKVFLNQGTLRMHVKKGFEKKAGKKSLLSLRQ